MTTTQTQAAAKHPGVEAVELDEEGEEQGHILPLHGSPPPADSFMVFPTDGKNQTQTSQTEQFLQNLVGKENVDPPFIVDNEIWYWVCNSMLFLPRCLLAGFLKCPND